MNNNQKLKVLEIRNLIQHLWNYNFDIVPLLNSFRNLKQIKNLRMQKVMEHPFPQEMQYAYPSDEDLEDLRCSWETDLGDPFKDCKKVEIKIITKKAFDAIPEEDVLYKSQNLEK